MAVMNLFYWHNFCKHSYYSTYPPIEQAVGERYRYRYTLEASSPWHSSAWFCDSYKLGGSLGSLPTKVVASGQVEWHPGEGGHRPPLHGADGLPCHGGHAPDGPCRGGQGPEGMLDVDSSPVKHSAPEILEIRKVEARLDLILY